MELLDRMLKELINTNGSDLHIQSEAIPKIRVEGQLKNLNILPLDRFKVELIKDSLNIPSISLGRFIDDWSTDFRYTHPTLGQFRTNISSCDSGLKITMRNLNKSIKDLESLGFNEKVFKDIIPLKKGLVIITGSTNSGKSTTLASLVKEISKLKRNIITLEDPIEYFFSSRESMVTQREYGTSFKTFPKAIEAAMRQDPDVIMLGEMRDKETIKAALLAAETGHLVLATLHATDISSIKNRIVIPFKSNEREEVGAIFEQELTLAIAQELVYNETTKHLELNYSVDKRI